MKEVMTNQKAMCFNSLSFLVLFSWTAFPAVQSISVSSFYPFGSSSGDSKLHKNDDGSSGPLDISISFPYFDQNHDKLYVNTNGVISFLSQVSKYTPDAFPLGNDNRLLTPFWADVDTTKGGDVWYRETTDNKLLNRASIDIRRALIKFRRFTPTWLYVVTWDNVSFYGSDETDNQKRNSFQAVLATNGRHSFVIYNYAKIQWLAGTASNGTPAQCGFNAGDGKTYYTIKGSRTNAVLNLPKTSNVNRPGVWMFKVDAAEIQSEGCNTKGRLTISPRKALMLGGEIIYIAGPCFSKTLDKIICNFGGKVESHGSYITEVKAKCVAPMVNETGRIQLKVSLDDGKTFPFKGFFYYVTLIKQMPLVRRSPESEWVEGKQAGIQWDPKHLGDDSKSVKIEMANFKLKRGEIQLDGFVSISTQKNTGTSTIVLPTKGANVKWSGDDRSVSILRVSKNTAQLSNNEAPCEWIWSDVFLVINSSKALSRCKYWKSNEPDPSTFKEDSSLLPCPRSVLQAIVDRGNYMTDETCDGKNREACEKYHPKAYKCFRTLRPSSKGAGQQCCYNNEGILINTIPGAGHLHRVHINTGIPYISHYFHDVLPYHECCLFSHNCEDYYKKRPNDDGSNYDPPRAAFGVGDPHMVTLDGVEYTFNGFGEYTLLKVEPNGFLLQGRMEQLSPRNGRQIQATVYTAFAMKENGSDIIEIRLNGRGFIDVVVNRELQEFDDEHEVDYKNVMVMKEVNSSKYSTIFNSGIAVITEGFSDLMQFTIMMPKQFKKNTSGLLGYWDDDKDQEFLLPNGSYLNTSSNSKTIHYNFGLKWATQAHRSLFTYGPGKSHQTYSNPQFIPSFMDLSNIAFDNPVLERDARSTCGNSIQCLFDVKATGDPNIGLATRNSIQEIQAIINITETKACVPLDSSFANGFYERNDSEGRITYRYACKPGFFLNGSSVISCFQGKWNGTAPTCISLKECPSVNTTISNGKARTRGSLPAYGSAVYFDCVGDYDLIGARYIVCRLDSTWSNAKPYCRKRCSRVTSPHANTTYNETEQYVTAYFSCIKGYSIIGPRKKIICSKSNGIWNDTPPSCQLVGPVENQFDSKETTNALVIGVTLTLVTIVILCITLIGYILFKRKSNSQASHSKALRTDKEETLNLTARKVEQKRKVKVVYL